LKSIFVRLFVDLQNVN